MAGDPRLVLLGLSGWKARITYAVVGTPFFGVGGVILLLAALDAKGPGVLIPVFFGGALALIGVIMYRRALRGADFVLRLGSSSSSSAS
jgi:hypothetical protein